jgi:hypothetical protein
MHEVEQDVVRSQGEFRGEDRVGVPENALRADDGDRVGRVGEDLVVVGLPGGDLGVQTLALGEQTAQPEQPEQGDDGGRQKQDRGVDVVVAELGDHRHGGRCDQRGPQSQGPDRMEPG